MSDATGSTRAIFADVAFPDCRLTSWIHSTVQPAGIQVCAALVDLACCMKSCIAGNPAVLPDIRMSCSVWHPQRRGKFKYTTGFEGTYRSGRSCFQRVKRERSLLNFASILRGSFKREETESRPTAAVCRSHLAFRSARPRDPYCNADQRALAAEGKYCPGSLPACVVIRPDDVAGQ